MRDYREYRYSGRERLQYGLMGMAGTFFILYLFYWSVPLCLPLSVVGAVLFLRYQRGRLAVRRRWELMTEFKDAMESMVSALTAGYSMENAVSEAYRDLQLMCDGRSLLLEELKDMEQKIRLKYPLDKLLIDLGRRSGEEDILTFAQLYATARKSGGNLVKIMKRTADNIGEKMEIQREIQTMIAGKKMEATCMMVIPLLIILYMQIFSPGFLDPLYRGLAGRLIMTGALLVYGAAVCWSRALMQIEC